MDVQDKPLALARRHPLSLAGMAGAVLLAVVVLAGTRSQSQPVDNHLARFVPTDEQLRSFQVETVGLRTFRTEISTDGYIAAGSGGKATGGMPVLPAQASDMLQAENDLAAARVQYRNAAAVEARQRKLYHADGAALKDWQQSQADLATAAAALASARNRLRLLGRSDDGKAGIVTVDNSAVWLIANVREADAGQVHIGDPVKARLIAYPTLALAGTVNFISSVIDPATHRLVIGARIANPGGQLKPNMLALANVLGGDVRQAAAVPQNTIVYDGDQAHIWVVGPGRRLSSRRVTLGRTSGGYVEITSGLSAGERVATAGALFIDQAVNGD